MRITDRARSLHPSATLAITGLAARMKSESGRDVIALSAGQPDFRTPAPIAEAALKAISEGKTGYTPAAGIPELRQSVASRYSARHGADYSEASVVISCGAKHSIANLVLAAVEQGDGVLIPRPYWVSYPEMIALAGGRVMLPASFEQGKLSLSASDVERAIEEGARGILLNSPNNPTGLVIGREELESIAAVLRKSPEVWVISDDIYEDLTYLDDGESCPHILEVAPDLADRVACVSGVSKTYSMTGWRIGYAMSVNRDWITASSRIQAHTTSNPCSISQWAALSAVRGEAEAERIEMLEAFSRRRDLICGLLSSETPQLELDSPPKGAFYVFPKILPVPAPGSRSSGSADSQEFCKRLLETEAVAAIPGAAFGSDGYVRLSFAASERDITIAVERISRFMGGVRPE